MSMMFPDRVLIESISRDENFRTETIDSQTEIDAYVEQEDKIQYSGLGQPIKPRVLIMLPKDAVIKKDDYIRIIKAHGQYYEIPDYGMGFWHFDNSTKDESPYANDGSLVGSPVYASGISRQSLLLNGAGQYMYVPANVNLNTFANGDFSIAFWMKSKDSTPLDYSSVFSKYVDANNRLTVLTSVLVSYKLQFLLVKSGITVTVTFNTNPYTVQWRHVAFVADRNEDKLYLYVDGICDSVVGDLSTLPKDISNVATLILGNYEGQIDEYRIWKRTLSAEEVQFLANTPRGYLWEPSRKKVDEVFPVGGSKISHYEVYVGK